MRRASSGPRVMNPVKIPQAVAPAARAWRALSGLSMPPVAMSSRRSPKRSRTRRTFSSVVANRAGPERRPDRWERRGS